ncbi:hypothetical protein FRB94_008277 [Tulasnella sp. JGI-2019a]|nr:hypothetical protein FRB94_008277 [Tulasnella sp. JGI-2019a]KAG9004914.1 hypothetical protein FRB93_010093 [Tulasnella sp. JGI-2019a]KAG9027628.1 hypothetical protein FRB95_007562 [Tulasnella sp. JGI-2019a]
MSQFMFNQQQQQPNAYSQASSSSYYAQPGISGPPTNLQFYSSSTADDSTGGFYASRPSLEGNMASPNANGGSGGSAGQAFGGSIQSGPTGWVAAFSSVGYDGEPPLLEELGINFSHIYAKSMTVLNPLRQIDERIMDDADMAGPICFFFAFGMFLLLSGRSQFGYIYGIALMGSLSIYALLNLMSTNGIDAYRTASVLGYCLLPMVGVGALSVGRNFSTLSPYMIASLSIISVVWCTYAASSIFVTILRMSDQRLLVAYPVGLLYGTFALFSVFDVSTVSGK